MAPTASTHSKGFKPNICCLHTSFACLRGFLTPDRPKKGHSWMYRMLLMLYSTMVLIIDSFLSVYCFWILPRCIYFHIEIWRSGLTKCSVELAIHHSQKLWTANLCTMQTFSVYTCVLEGSTFAFSAVFHCIFSSCWTEYSIQKVWYNFPDKSIGTPLLCKLIKIKAVYTHTHTIYMHIYIYYIGILFTLLT